MEFTIKVNKIPSVNSLYSYNPKTKQKYLSKEGKVFKETLKLSLQQNTQVLNDQFKRDSITLINNNDNITNKDFDKNLIAYNVNILFHLNSSILRRDVSNLIKATEDAIFEYLNINDNRVFSITSKKILNDIFDKFDNKEMITVTINPIGKTTDLTLSKILNNYKKDHNNLEVTFNDAIYDYMKK